MASTAPLSTLEAIVHDGAQAEAALRAARAVGAAARLFSAPGAALSVGPGFWRALADALTASYSGVTFDTVLDCADDAGAALAALDAGIDCIRYTGRPDVRARLAEIAGGAGARLFDGPLPALDLARAADPEAACRAALHCHRP